MPAKPVKYDAGGFTIPPSDDAPAITAAVHVTADSINVQVNDKLSGETKIEEIKDKN